MSEKNNDKLLKPAIGLAALTLGVVAAYFVKTYYSERSYQRDQKNIKYVTSLDSEELFKKGVELADKNWNGLLDDSERSSLLKELGCYVLEKLSPDALKMGVSEEATKCSLEITITKGLPDFDYRPDRTKDVRARKNRGYLIMDVTVPRKQMEAYVIAHRKH